jgi:hypothetical protein
VETEVVLLGGATGQTVVESGTRLRIWVGFPLLVTVSVLVE